MKRKTHYGTLCFVLVAIFLPSGSNAQQQPDLSINRSYKTIAGKPHPDFILPTIEPDRSLIQLSDFRGKKVLLLHFASW